MCKKINKNLSKTNLKIILTTNQNDDDKNILATNFDEFNGI